MKQKTSLHQKLYSIIRRHINEGIYKEGDLLPSENELSQLHGLTRPTVRLALAKLENEGYITKHQGKGSIVDSRGKEIGILSISGTTSAAGNRDLKTRIIIKPEIIPWPDDFMFPLSPVETESGCVHMERVRFLDDEPVFYDINYIANVNLPRITSRNFENKSLFSILRYNYNIEIRGGEQRIKAIPAATRIARCLGMKKDQPLLHLERKLETNEPGLFLYSSIYCNTGKYSIFGKF